MKLKLSYNPTYTFVLADTFDASDDQLVFEAHARQPAEWARLVQAWLKDDAEDVARALEIVGRAITSVGQGGEKWPIEGREGAEALRDAIEEANPGHGDAFIKNLALGHYNYHFQRLGEMMGNSSKPSPASVDGGNPNGTKLAVKV